MRPGSTTHPKRLRARATSAAIGALAVGVLTLATASPADARPAPPRVIPGPAPNIDPPSSDPNVAIIAYELSGVRVDGVEYRASKRQYDDVFGQLQEVHGVRIGAEQKIASLQATEASLTQLIRAETARKKHVRVQLAAIRSSLRSLAVAAYMEGSQPEPDSLDEVTEMLGRQTEVATISDSQHERARRAEINLNDVLRQLNDHVMQRAVVRNDISTTQQALAQSVAEEARLSDALAVRKADLAQARARSVVVGSDFTLLAMDAYWRAAKETAATRPRCGIQWWALAGITRIESHHGTYGGAALLGNGDTSPHIIGISLDGSNNTAVISDTDHGQWDGDDTYDHAVGPMQFIPSTWTKWQADGNGDGSADPNNIYDAAEAAAHYLCATGPMVSEDDLLRGFYSYNHSDDYAQAVLDNALFYSQITIPPPVPDDAEISALSSTTPVASGG